MTVISAHPDKSVFSLILRNISAHAGKALGLLIVTAALFFEIFNFSTTDYALRDLLGNLKFLGLPWSTTLAIAFCAIDFAGLARLFTIGPEPEDDPHSNWYLFGAWMLAAMMNACLTWWGVSMAIVNHPVESTAVVSSTVITIIAPIMVAAMVWVIRILIIGSISLAGQRLLWSEPRPSARPLPSRSMAGQTTTAIPTSYAPRPVARPASIARPSSAMPRSVPAPQRYTEPTYQSLNSSDRSSSGDNFS